MKRLEKSTWALIAAALAAVVTVTAAVVVLVGSDTTTPGTKVNAAPAGAPEVTWTLDAAKYLGRPFGQFADPREGAVFNSDSAGFVKAGDILVTLAGSPTKDYSLGDAVMIGIDPRNGRVRWKTPAADIEGCGATPIKGKLYCYASDKVGRHDIVAYDIESGESARRAIDEFVFAIETTSDTLYIVEGNPEEDDVRVHSGDFENVSANWTRPFDIGSTWDGVYETQVLAVTDGVGLLDIGGQMAQFTAESGAELWRSTDYRVRTARLESGGVVVQSNTEEPSGTQVVSQMLRGPDAKVLVTTTVPAVQGFDVGPTSDADRPVLMGDAAYNRTSGRRLWANRDLLASQGDDFGTVTAVTDDVVYLTDRDISATGLDLRTGKRLWRNTGVTPFTPRAVKANVVAGDDGETLTALDVETGRTVWTKPFSALDPGPETFRSGGAMVSDGHGWVFSSDRRMIGLAPR